MLTYFHYCFTADLTVVHVGGHSPPNISAVAKDACTVAKDHVIPCNSAGLSSKTTTTAAVEPVPRYNELANQRSLSDKLDLSVASAGMCLPKTPFTRYNRLSNRLYNWFDNRLYRVNKHPTGCQTGCQTGLTISLTTVLNEQHCSFNRFSNRVVQPA